MDFAVDELRAAGVSGEEINARISEWTAEWI